MDSSRSDDSAAAIEMESVPQGKENLGNICRILGVWTKIKLRIHKDGFIYGLEIVKGVIPA